MIKKLKNIASNGLPYAIVFFGLSLMIGYLFHLDLKITWWTAILIALAALLTNGLIYTRFSKPLKSLENIVIKIDSQEQILLQTPANYRLQENLVPGKLCLTNQRLIFKAFENSENTLQECSWNLDYLKPLNFYGSLWNLGGEFLIQTTNEITLMFEVNELKLWKQAFKKS